MKFLGMGVPELLIILAVILLVFGPKNLPKLGSALGRTVKNVREGLGSGKEESQEEAQEEPEVVQPEQVKTTTTTTVRKKSE